jgi:hypothetical protein
MKQLGFKDECLGEWQSLKTGHNLVVDEEEDRIFDVAILNAEVRAPLYQQALDFLSLKGYAMAYKSNKVSLNKDLLSMLEYILKKEQTEG